MSTVAVLAPLSIPLSWLKKGTLLVAVVVGGLDGMLEMGVVAELGGGIGTFDRSRVAVYSFTLIPFNVVDGPFVT